ncbi:hypothetical protein F3Y22_tig00110239pilonHSYRG00355 [Hibiscus syriacus]|uniref:Inositol-pentakisphosphate 2-kinase n=1 Tax=Hibiscus syriacus TaxID=106335 RepID=A0A6A3BCZ3_HIBSY|nr:hypothetical protein F3Y22_tig00110239pilonHSYRG00355 [Hibiscus syriacus]
MVVRCVGSRLVEARSVVSSVDDNDDDDKGRRQHGLGGGTDRTTALVGEAFEDILENVVQADSGQHTTGFIQLVAEAIYTSGALRQLLEVQKLDTHDI